MVKALILYYLNIKSTHGYEIQKYIQTTGLSTWAKVKSGSIYYALSKMEQKGEVELVKEETQGSRVRRIYKITDKGREELKKVLKGELGKNLVPIGTDKFIIPMFMNQLDKESAIKLINEHIEELKSTLEYWNYWKDIKVNEKTNEVEKISFNMTISNLEYSIRWHEALIKDYDHYVIESEKQCDFIKNFNFDELEDSGEEEKIVLDKEKIKELRNIILNNPEGSKDALEQLLKYSK